MGAKRTKAQQKRFLKKLSLKRKKASRLVGIMGNLIGHLTEQRFFEAFQSAELPPWFKQIKKASRRLDRIGVDAVVETDCGEFYVQVKSSEIRAIKFGKIPTHKGISIVVPRPNDSPEFIVHQTIVQLENARKEVLEGTRASKLRI